MIEWIGLFYGEEKRNYILTLHCVAGTPLNGPSCFSSHLVFLRTDHQSRCKATHALKSRLSCPTEMTQIPAIRLKGPRALDMPLPSLSFRLEAETHTSFGVRSMVWFYGASWDGTIHSRHPNPCLPLPTWTRGSGEVRTCVEEAPIIHAHFSIEAF